MRNFFNYEKENQILINELVLKNKQPFQILMRKLIRFREKLDTIIFMNIITLKKSTLNMVFDKIRILENLKNIYFYYTTINDENL